jgi:hypothetical protein
VRARLRSARPQSLLLGRLPPAWFSSASATGRRVPARLRSPSPEDGHRLPVPRMRCTNARSTALRRVRRLWTEARTRWIVPPLRRDGRHQRPSRCASLGLRLRRGGDQPNLTIIDNDIASHGIAATTPFGITENQRTIRAELTVLFQPFQLYEFPVIRTLQASTPRRMASWV